MRPNSLQPPADFETLPVSVVIPVRNQPMDLWAAVLSVLNQGPFRPAEILVVDDASDDETPAVGEQLGARVLRLPERLGPGQARNHGVRAAQHPWVAFLDADDAWLIGHLARLWWRHQDYVLLADSGIGSVTNRIYGWPGRRPLELVSPRQVIFPANCVQPSGALVRRDVLRDVGGFPVSGMSEDMDTWIRVLERGPGLLLPSIGWSYREHETQLSSDREVMQDSELEVVRRYQSRSWYGDELVRWLEARHRWEQAVASAHDRDARELLRQVSWFAQRPRYVSALAPLMFSRRKLRRHQLKRDQQ